MNPFAARTQKTLDIPFDLPNTVTIRRLPGRHLQRAALENQFESVTRFRKMGGAAFQRELEAVGDQEKRDKAVQEAQADPLNAYDRYILMTFGIVSWTYPESLTPVVVVDEESALLLEAAAAVTALLDKSGTVAAAAAGILAAAKTGRRVVPAIEDLSDEAAEFFAREILRLSKPALFQTAEEAEADRKNG